MMMDSPSKAFVYASQTLLWTIFVTLDACLLIPSVLLDWMMMRRGDDNETSSSSSKTIVQVDNHHHRQQQRRQKTVVIVGGSFSGLAALRTLQNHNSSSSHVSLKVVLIDQRDYFEYTPGILRLFCEPNLVSQLAHPLGHARPGTAHDYQFLQGTVTKIPSSAGEEQQYVTYVDAATKRSNIRIAYDYLILATGSTYNHPITAPPTERTLAARERGWQKTARTLEEARSVLILGGGAVGTELAAEIVDHYHHHHKKKKVVTVVDACPKLVPVFENDEVSEYAETWLKSRGVTLLLGKMLKSWDAKSCVLMDGTRLEADLVFVCFGDKPNSGPLVVAAASSDDDDRTSAAAVKLDRRKCVKTDAFLRVEGRHNVFCCGDVAAPPTEGLKQAFHAEVQGHVAAENVIRLATAGRQQAALLKRYPEDATHGSPLMPLVYVLSLGKWDGIIGFNRLTVPGPLAAVVKWILEWTKIRQMLNRPVGALVWNIGDAVTFFLSKHCMHPAPKKI